MDNIVIREMLAEDCNKVSHLNCDSFKFGAQLAGFSFEQITDYFANHGSEEAIRLQLQKYQCLIACTENKIVGLVCINANEIAKLYVDPQHIRQGIGTALFNAAEKIITKTGCMELVLDTAFDSSIPFYQSMNMIKTEKKSVTHGSLKGADLTILKKRLHNS